MNLCDANPTLQETLDQLEARVRERTAELERVKNRFEAIFNYSGDGILLLDIECRIQEVNAAFVALVAFEADDLGDKPFCSLIAADDVAQFQATLAQVKISAQKQQIDAQLIRSDGSYLDVEISIAPLCSGEQQVTNVVCIVRDVSERKKAERSLSESENKLQSVIDNIPARVFWKDRNSVYQGCNLIHARSNGMQDPKYIIGKTDHDFAPERAPEWEAVDRQVMASGLPELNMEELVQDVDGSAHWLRSNKVALRAADGSIVGVLVTIEDITERKTGEEALRHSERELRESQKKLQMVLDTIPVRVFWKDHDSVLQGCNRLFAQDAGFESVPTMVAHEQASRLSKQAHPDIYRADDVAVIETGIAKLEFEESFVRPNGEELVIQTSKLPLRDEEGKIIGLLGTYIDITARRKAETTLAQKFEEEQEMQGYLKALHEITLHLTQTDTLDEFYHDVVALGLKHFAFERIGFFLHHEETGEVTGTYGTDINRQVVTEYDIRFDLRTLSESLKQGFENNERFAFFPEIPLFADGKLICKGQCAIAALWQGGGLGWLSIDNAIYHKPISKAQLEILALYAVTASSLLTRKRAEIAMRESEERFRVFTESAPIATFIADQQGTILLVNPETERLLGYKRDELVGQSVALLIPDNPKYIESVQSLNSKLCRERSEEDTIELLARRKDGMLFPADLQLRYIEIQAKPMIMHLVIDSTQRKQAEQTLRQSLEQEKELVQLRTRFVSMASHEFRTPLAAILAATETIIAYRDRMNPAQIDARLNKIRQQVMHMRDLMEDVLYLARVQAGRAEFRPTRGNLDLLCLEIMEVFEGQPEYRGRIVYSSTLYPAPHCYDENLVRKVVNNLISNALKYSAPEKEVYLTLAQDATHIQIAVRDQGIGIPANDLKHLFEPFHRAENVGTIAGTGLGLSIAKQAAELHGGTLLVESQVNVGTVFTVMLPVS
ncbi:MAG: PAS domain S-box protein [Caldilineaceae bacterium]